MNKYIILTKTMLVNVKLSDSNPPEKCADLGYLAVWHLANKYTGLVIIFDRSN